MDGHCVNYTGKSNYTAGWEKTYNKQLYTSDQHCKIVEHPYELTSNVGATAEGKQKGMSKTNFSKISVPVQQNDRFSSYDHDIATKLELWYSFLHSTCQIRHMKYL